MLPKLKILMLLATIVPESLSAPTNATKTKDSPRDDDTRNDTINFQEVTNLLDMDLSVEDVKQLAQNASFATAWDKTSAKFTANLLKAMAQGQFSQLDQPIKKFNSNLMKELVKSAQGNILISPISIHTALAMFYYASPMHTDTHDELGRVLCLDDDWNEWYLADYYTLLEYYASKPTGLALASKLFLKGSISLRPDFREFLGGFFGSSPESLEYLPTKAIDQINNYVKEKTKGMIEKIVKPGEITPKTSMVVVNAIYHKDGWLYPFNREETKPMVFTRLDGTVVIADGMWMLNEDLRIGESIMLDCRYLELPYKNGFKMIVVVPNQNTREALNTAAARFNFESGLESLAVQDYGVEVVMPRMKIEYDEDLSDHMKSLGLISIFDPLYASDLRHMTSMGGLRVDNIIHKSRIIVNEEGTEAAAATVVSMCTRELCNRPIKFLVNQPFAVFIVDPRHNVVVFSGVVFDPTEEGGPVAKSRAS